MSFNTIAKLIATENSMQVFEADEIDPIDGVPGNILAVGPGANEDQKGAVIYVTYQGETNPIYLNKEQREELIRVLTDTEEK